MSMEELSSVLWQERELLETLLFKLEVEQLVLAGGRSRWLPAAAREIDACLGRIREVELLRAVAVDNVAAELGVEPNPSLHEIADRCEEPWRSIWLDHREAFTTVATQIGQMSESNRTLLTAGYQAAQATLLSMTEGAGTYAADGSVAADRRTSLVDRSL
ncbi:MAG TPA: flagellar protein FlgN [Nocardioidaceae bacterium]|nr:flagellar protein FlgN [Nocardioidaceae bacterium]